MQSDTETYADLRDQRRCDESGKVRRAQESFCVCETPSERLSGRSPRNWSPEIAPMQHRALKSDGRASRGGERAPHQMGLWMVFLGALRNPRTAPTASVPAVALSRLYPPGSTPPVAARPPTLKLFFIVFSWSLLERAWYWGRAHTLAFSGITPLGPHRPPIPHSRHPTRAFSGLFLTRSVPGGKSCGFPRMAYDVPGMDATLVRCRLELQHQGGQPFAPQNTGFSTRARVADEKFSSSSPPVRRRLSSSGR